MSWLWIFFRRPLCQTVSKAFSMSISRSAVILLDLFACSRYWLMITLLSTLEKSLVTDRVAPVEHLVEHLTPSAAPFPCNNCPVGLSM